MNIATWYTTTLTVLIFWGLAAAAADAQTVARGDYPINDESYVLNTSMEEFPDVAASMNGFTAVWQSRRNTGKTDVLARQFDAAGNALGAAFRVNDFVMTSSLVTPSVARYSPGGSAGDSAGTFVVVWSEPGFGSTSGTVYARVFGNSGNALGAHFNLDPNGIGGQYEAAIAMHPAGLGNPGSFIVTWVDRREDRSHVLARAFNRNGDAAGEAFRVHDDTTRLGRSRPAIAIGGAPGVAVIAWEEIDQGVPHVRARIFTTAGLPIGPAFSVDTLAPNASAPRVGVAGDGTFVVVYGTVLNGRQYVYAQRFSAAGSRTGAPIPVDNTAKLSHRLNPDVAMHAGSGTEGYGFVVTWDGADSAQLPGIYTQSFNGAGVPQGEKVLVRIWKGSFDPAIRVQAVPAIAAMEYRAGSSISTRALVVWPDVLRDYPADIRLQLLEGDMTIGETFRVNDLDTGGVGQRRGAIDATPGGMQAVVWMDERAGGFTIHGKRLSSDGVPLGPDFRINDSTLINAQFAPDIAVFPDSSFVVAWGANSGSEIIGLQRFDARGERAGPRIALSYALGVYGIEPALDGTPDGRFIVVWRNSISTTGGTIGGRRYLADGTPDGPVFRIDDDALKSDGSAPAVAVAPDGSFTVAWSDIRSGGHDIWYQRYDANGQPLGSNTRANDVAGDGWLRGQPAIDIAPDGTVMIAWPEYRPEALRGDVTAQRFDRNGARIGGNVRVNDRDTSLPLPCESCPTKSISVAAAKPVPGTENNASFVIGWIDAREGTDITNVYAQWYAGDGRSLGANIRASNGPAGTMRQLPDVARDGGTRNTAYFAWEDDRHPDDKRSIWGAIMDTTLGTTGVNVSVSEYTLNLHAQPNPSSSRVTFSFSLPEAAHVRLTLYTVQGTPVATIVEDTFGAGPARAEWQPEGVPSGAYLYQLESGALRTTGSLVIAR